MAGRWSPVVLVVALSLGVLSAPLSAAVCVTRCSFAVAAAPNEWRRRRLSQGNEEGNPVWSAFPQHPGQQPTLPARGVHGARQFGSSHAPRERPGRRRGIPRLLDPRQRPPVMDPYPRLPSNSRFGSKSHSPPNPSLPSSLENQAPFGGAFFYRVEGDPMASDRRSFLKGPHDLGGRRNRRSRARAAAHHSRTRVSLARGRRESPPGRDRSVRNTRRRQAPPGRWRAGSRSFTSSPSRSGRSFCLVGPSTDGASMAASRVPRSR